MLSNEVKPHLIITIHGIRTFGKWQERLEQLARDEDTTGEIEFCHFKLGYFSLFAFLVPPFRWLIVRRFRNELRALIKSGNRVRIDLVGHSFGTHVIGWALWGLRPDEDMRIHTVILSGSVLRSGFNWSRLIGTRVRRVINDCGARDKVLLLSQFCVLFTGMAGRTGFSGMTSQSFRNRVSLFGHSGYFQDDNRKPDDSYMKNHWIELLVHDHPIRHFNNLPEGGALNGVVFWISNNAEPIKLTFYLAPLVAVTLWVWGQRQEAVHQREIATKERGIAETQRDIATANEILAKENERRALANEKVARERLTAVQENQSRFIASAAKEILPTNPGRSLALTLEVIPENVRNPDRPIIPEALSVAFRAAETERSIGILSGHTQNVRAASFSRDGMRIITASADKSARVWDSKTGANIAILNGHTDKVNAVAFSPDGTRVVTASRDKTARIWDATSGAQLKILGNHEEWVQQADFSPNGLRIVTASGHTARVWDTMTGTEIAVLKGYQDDIGSIAFSPDGKLIAATTGLSLDVKDKTVRVWIAETGVTQTVIRGHGDGVNSIAFSPSGKLLATGSTDNTARIWEVETGHQVSILKGHTDAVTTVTFNRQGDQIVTASEDRTARLWDVKSGLERTVLRGHTGNLEDAQFSPDGNAVATASMDGTARLWSSKTGAELAILRVGDQEVQRAIYSPDGASLITVAADSDVHIWDPLVRADAITLNGVGVELNSLAFSHDNSRMITTSKERTPILWSAKTGARLAELKGHTDIVYKAVFSSDDQRILTASADGTARIWDGGSGAQKGQLRVGGGASIVWDVQFSIDDKAILIAADENVQIWDGSKYTLRRTFPHSDQVYQARFNGDGTRILTITSEKSVRLWDSETGNIVASLGGPPDGINSAKFSTDGKLIVTASEKGSVKLWSAVTGAEILRLAEKRDWTSDASFSSDGKYVIAATRYQPVIWDIETRSETIALPAHKSFLHQVFFTSDGTQIVSASTDEVRVMDAITGAVIRSFSMNEGIAKSAVSGDGSRLAIGLKNGSLQVRSIPVGRSDIWLPALRARSFYRLSAEDKSLFGSDAVTGVDTEANSNSCDGLAADPFDPGRVTPGVVGEIDLPSAIAACRDAQSAQPNEPRFSYQLARVVAANRQYKEAEESYKIAAQSKYAMAFYRLATLYEKGPKGITKDQKKAFEFYSFAFDQGVVISGSSLGQMLWDGEGVDRDREKALLIWKKAANLGDPTSHEKLAWLSEWPRAGGKLDIELALFHYTIETRLLEVIRGGDADASYPRSRRATIARSLPVEAAAHIWQAAFSWKPGPTN